ncbi:NusG domain II-containing protein [Clostridium tunisiense]|uniref:NusG domain II-containing protein n=1 Tax=Clostridium tunisiense TaxID=219748 RepID=UPI001FA74FDA|nr:NusG domain II-containing protein [Clostridium tunisiense]
MKVNTRRIFYVILVNVCKPLFWLDKFIKIVTRMDDKMKIVKKWDVIIIVLLVVISFIPYLIFIYGEGSSNGEIYAIISVDGKEQRRIRLDNHTTTEEFNITTHEGVNKIKVEGSKIGVVDADCPDKVCVLPGLVNRPGERIVCLPHRVVIEIRGSKNTSDTEDFISR